MLRSIKGFTQVAALGSVRLAVAAHFTQSSGASAGTIGFAVPASHAQDTRISALILAGGKATRLGGFPKHTLIVDGHSIFERQCNVLAPRVAEIFVSGASIHGYRTVHDARSDAGPLAGITAGLAATQTPWLFVVAGDMPYLQGDLADRMLAARSENIDAVGIRTAGLPEPLLCVLHARVYEVAARRLASGRFKVSGLLTDEGLAVSWLNDVDPQMLANFNSPADVACAATQLERGYAPTAVRSTPRVRS
jgi:molybdopterin-guanine dinucleotide biosynthesis protein A